MQEPKNIQTLYEQWFIKYADIVNSVLLELPPLRVVNHHIPLISDNKQYHYHLPCYLDAMKLQLMEKLQQYWGSPRYGTPNISYQVVVQSQVVTIKFDTF